MKFKFHLFVQKHSNRTYTVTVLPFNDITSYGLNLDEIKAELSDAIKERVRNMPPHALQQLEFDPRVSLQRVSVELRPVDRKNHKKRREQLRLTFSLVVRPEDDGQLFVSVPRVGSPPLSFYVYSKDELQQQASIELAAWFDNASLEQLMEFRNARSESLDTLEVDVPLRKAREQPESAAPEAATTYWALREVGINLSAQIGEGRFRKTYRREQQVTDILNTLLAPRNNSVLLIGPPEAGKTALVHEVVRRIARKECPEALHGREVWMLTPDRLIAGAQFIGTWEERVKDIANECRQRQHILYVEDLPGLLEVGRWSKSDSNIAMALKPHIASGEVIVIGESSPERLTMGLSIGSSFINLFRHVQVEPMGEDESLAVLTQVARDLEREFDLRIDPAALDSALQLSRRFLPYRSLPGKAIRLIEETAAEANKTRPAPSQSDTPFSLLRRISRPTVERRQVISTFSRGTGLPEFIINDETRLDMAEVEKYFRERLIGQDQALAAMLNLIATVKAGLNDPKKPLGTFLFIGPTGVGKTEMAKTLAAYLFGDPSRLIRFDMSEYNGVDGAARLIGAFNNEGELTRRVREQPFCVVLLDEFEKADPRIYDIFLQVLGEGRLTDARGRTTSFQNAILIMTSNLGAGQRQIRAVGFGQSAADEEQSGQALDAHYRQQVERYFRPEFVNRIDQIVTFRPLTQAALRQIAARELDEILRRDGILRRNIVVEIDDSVIALVLEKGYSPVYGARPLKREIERLVVAPLAHTLAQRGHKEQHLLRVSVDGPQLVIRSLPIEDADRTETVTLTGAMQTGPGRSVVQRRMDAAALVEGLAVLRRKLADWDANDTVKEMRNEKAQLLQETQRPDFWRRGEEARAALTRFYFLDRLLQRLAQLLERAEYLEDFAVMISKERALQYQSDLARDYEALYHQVSYLDIELMTAHLPHRNQAMMLITGLGAQAGPIGPISDEWPRRLAEMYLTFAERKGYEFDLYTLQPSERTPGGMAFAQVPDGKFADLLERFAQQPRTAEIAIYMQGSNVFGFLKGERGLHKLAGRDSSADELAQVRVYAIPDHTSITEWLRDYQMIKTEIAEGKRAEPPKEKLTVVRAYSLDRGEKYIRDLRTGMRLTNVKDVMNKGLLDELILAYLQTEEANVTWEDRFPPTFPY